MNSPWIIFDAMGVSLHFPSLKDAVKSLMEIQRAPV